MEIADRRQWLSHFLHDLTGQMAALAANVDFLARFGPPAGAPQRADFDESVSDARGVFDRLKGTMRTVIDYDRYETGQLMPPAEVIVPKAAEIQVAAKTPATGIPASCRIDGFTKTMYAIVINVVQPASTSVCQLVFSL